jgi:hypothetical protein
MVTSLGPTSRWGLLTGESGAARRRPGRTDPEAPARTLQTAPCGGRWIQSALRHAVATAGIDGRATNSLNAARPRGVRQARSRADGQLPAERCAHRRLIRVHPRSPGGSTTPSSTSPRESRDAHPQVGLLWHLACSTCNMGASGDLLGAPVTYAGSAPVTTRVQLRAWFRRSAACQA